MPSLARTSFPIPKATGAAVVATSLRFKLLSYNLLQPCGCKLPYYCNTPFELSNTTVTMVELQAMQPWQCCLLNHPCWPTQPIQLGPSLNSEPFASLQSAHSTNRPQSCNPPVPPQCSGYSGRMQLSRCVTTAPRTSDPWDRAAGTTQSGRAAAMHCDHSDPFPSAVTSTPATSASTLPCRHGRDSALHHNSQAGAHVPATASSSSSPCGVG